MNYSVEKFHTGESDGKILEGKVLSIRAVRRAVQIQSKEKVIEMINRWRCIHSAG